MRTIFISQGLWELVQSGYEQPDDAAALAAWETKKRRIMKVMVRNFKDQEAIIVAGGEENPMTREERLISKENPLSTATCVVKMGIIQMIAGINVQGAAVLIILTKIVGFGKSKRPIFLRAARLQISCFILA